MKENYEEYLIFMTKQEKLNAYAVFLKEGCQDTYCGFISAFKNDIFNAETGAPIEIGGDCVATVSIR